MGADSGSACGPMGALDWKAVADLVDCSYRVVAIKRMIAAIDGGARKVKSAILAEPVSP